MHLFIETQKSVGILSWVPLTFNLGAKKENELKLRHFFKRMV
jgi:hypothetical protein